MKLCLATNNAHKVEEMQALLGNNFELLTLNQISCFDDIPETMNTFDGNSWQKASYIKEKYGFDCIADDSGLEIDALNGEPGVFSARYAGEHGNHEKNIAKVLSRLENVEQRGAQFRCVITLILNGAVNQFEGIVRGKITREKYGSEGFGYDPIFIPDGFHKTFAEMTMEEKNPISHRGMAIDKMLAFLGKK